MKPLLPFRVAALLAALAGAATAQQAPSTDSAAQPAPAGPKAKGAEGAEMADGEVRKVDRETGKITLRHGPIKSLDMPPMTMVFQVADRKLLDQLKAGDKVRFAATQEGGAYTVQTIEPVR